MPGVSRESGAAGAARKRFLVLCRAGDDSLHRQWMGDPAARSYDVWLDYYGDDDARWSADPVRLTIGRGTTKWPRLARLLAEHPEIARYDAVWFPDDDLALDGATVERLFAIMMQRDLDLAQPALLPRSHTPHPITVRNRSFFLRYTNFVEIMAPAFSARGLAACGETFGLSDAGWGLDLVWPRILGSPRDRIAIVDAAPMLHTRPLSFGRPGRPSIYAALKHDPHRQMADVAARYGVPLPFAFRHHAGVLAGSGRTVEASRREFLLRLVAGTPRRHLLKGWYWRAQLASLPSR